MTAARAEARRMTFETLAGTDEDLRERNEALRTLGGRLAREGPTLYGGHFQQAVQHAVTAATAHIVMLTDLTEDDAAIVARTLMRHLLPH